MLNQQSTQGTDTKYHFKFKYSKFTKTRKFNIHEHEFKTLI